MTLITFKDPSQTEITNTSYVDLFELGVYQWTELECNNYFQDYSTNSTVPLSTKMYMFIYQFNYQVQDNIWVMLKRESNNTLNGMPGKIILWKSTFNYYYTNVHSGDRDFFFPFFIRAIFFRNNQVVKFKMDENSYEFNQKRIRNYSQRSPNKSNKKQQQLKSGKNFLGTTLSRFPFC